MTTLSFAAQIDEWVKSTAQRQEVVFKASAQDVVEVMQRTAPVDTGFLKSSLEVKINQPLPATDKPQGAVSAAPDYAMVIAGAEIGDFISAGYSAVYGPRLEFGFTGQDKLGRTINQPPRAWIRGAAAQWQQIVTANVAKAKASVR